MTTPFSYSTVNAVVEEQIFAVSLLQTDLVQQTDSKTDVTVSLLDSLFLLGVLSASPLADCLFFTYLYSALLENILVN